MSGESDREVLECRGDILPVSSDFTVTVTRDGIEIESTEDYSYLHRAYNGRSLGFINSLTFHVEDFELIIKQITFILSALTFWSKHPNNTIVNNIMHNQEKIFFNHQMGCVKFFKLGEICGIIMEEFIAFAPNWRCQTGIVFIPLDVLNEIAVVSSHLIDLAYFHQGYTKTKPDGPPPKSYAAKEREKMRDESSMVAFAQEIIPDCTERSPDLRPSREFRNCPCYLSKLLPDQLLFVEAIEYWYLSESCLVLLSPGFLQFNLRRDINWKYESFSLEYLHHHKFEYSITIKPEQYDLFSEVWILLLKKFKLKESSAVHIVTDNENEQITAKIMYLNLPAAVWSNDLYCRQKGILLKSISYGVNGKNGLLFFDENTINALEEKVQDDNISIFEKLMRQANSKNKNPIKNVFGCNHVLVYN